MRRGLIVHATCVLCDGYPVNSWHRFVSCPYAQTCWREANLDVLNSLVDQAKGFDELVFMIFNEMVEAVVGKFVMFCWSIWHQRNIKYWQNKRVVLHSQAVFSTLGVFCDWLHARELVHGSSNISHGI